MGRETTRVVARRRVVAAGHDDRQQSAIALEAAREYRTSTALFAEQTRLEVWYAKLDLSAVFLDLKGFFSDHAKRKIDLVVGEAKRQDTAAAFAKVVTYEGGTPTIVDDPPSFRAPR